MTVNLMDLMRAVASQSDARSRSSHRGNLHSGE